MKNVIASLTILMILSACSKSDNSPKNNSTIQESFLSVNIGQEDILLDLESIPYGKSKDSTFHSAEGIGETGASSGFNGTVITIEIDSNNIYVGGYFTDFKGVANSARYIAKLNSNGVMDSTFHSASGIGETGASSGFNSYVSTIAIDSNDNLYAGGGFTQFKGVANSANRIAKLNSNGEERPE